MFLHLISLYYYIDDHFTKDMNVLVISNPKPCEFKLWDVKVIFSRCKIYMSWISYILQAHIVKISRIDY